MKTILFISHSSSRTGAPLLLLDIATMLRHEGYALEFAVGEDGPLLDEFRRLGPTSLDPLYPDEMKYWRELKRVKRRLAFIRGIQPDLVYCNTIHSAKWLLYARTLGIPTLAHIHELAMAFASVGLPERLMVKHCSDRIIAVSRAVKSYLTDVETIAPSKIDMVRAGIRLDRFTSSGTSNARKASLGLDNAVVVGTVGRIAHVKGSDLLLDLAAETARDATGGPTIRFLVVASTYDRESYRRFLAERSARKLDNMVIVVEDIDDVKPYYEMMDVYLSTAREDPFPLVILEAMASRLPVVAFAVGGIPEAISGSTGILVPPLDLHALAEAVQRLARNASQRESMGQAGRSRVEAEFDLAQNVKSISAIIARVIAG